MNFLSKCSITLLIILFTFLFSGCLPYRHVPFGPNESYAAAARYYAAKDYARSFQALWMPAQYNQPRAMYAMGYMYYFGIGTDKDQDIGRSLIRRAADQNYGPAVIALKLITQRKYNQYIPLETYDTHTMNKGSLDVRQPINPSRKYNQYVPSETYDVHTMNENSLDVKKPIKRSRKYNQYVLSGTYDSQTLNEGLVDIEQPLIKRSTV